MQNYLISTDISHYIRCGFEPLLMYMQNKPCSACGGQKCLFVFRDPLFAQQIVRLRMSETIWTCCFKPKFEKLTTKSFVLFDGYGW